MRLYQKPATVNLTDNLNTYILSYSDTRSRRGKHGFASHGGLPSVGATTHNLNQYLTHSSLIEAKDAL